MFLLLCIVIIHRLLEELLPLSRVTVGGNVKAVAGELLAWAPVHLHHTLPLATTLQFVLCSEVVKMEQCVRPIFQLPSTLHIASPRFSGNQVGWSPMQESKWRRARGMEAFEWWPRRSNFEWLPLIKSSHLTTPVKAFSH